MKKNIIQSFLVVCLLSSCTQYTQLYKSNDYDYRYEAAKEYYASGNYSKSAALLSDMISILKGSDRGEESLYMLAMSYYKDGDIATAATTFQQYYTVYPRGKFTERARFNAGKALYESSPEYQLEQSGTYRAIQELQVFMEYFPNSAYHDEAQNMIFEMQDKLVEKELGSARLYYNLGTYLGNNYQSCVITAQNALKEYPYTKFREDLSVLVLKAKYELALNSVLSKRADRYRDAIDECYAFKNEFPDSRNVKLADDILKTSEKVLPTLPSEVDEDEMEQEQ